MAEQDPSMGDAWFFQSVESWKEGEEVERKKWEGGGGGGQ